MRAVIVVVIALVSCCPLLAQGNSWNSQKPVTLQIVDATGKFVAYPYQIDNAVAVRPVNDGTFVAIMVDPQTIRATEHAFFESTDCSGTPLLHFYEHYLTARTCKLGSDSRIYYGTGTPVTRALRSRLSLEGVCSAFTGVAETQEATAVAFDLAQFQPPFRLVR